MSKYLYSILLITFIINDGMNAQPTSFTVKLAPFSSRTSGEFAPVYYNGGIVFCSNLSDNSLVSYQDGQNRLFKIFYVVKKGETGWSLPRLFANEITTDFNDGPVTFNENGNIIYYSRNNLIKNNLRNISDTSNKLGIYSAELIDGIWTDIKPFTNNNPLYNYTTPSLTPDGERIYFSSDMPGGYGGMDLYYCDRQNNDWSKPINMGPAINTPKNESFPFASKYGKLFFASDGHPGFGGKDIYYTLEINREWIVPVHLDSAINSPADDFGFVADSTFENGFFSTNRRNTDDIFSFSTPPVEFAECDTLKENNYCFTLYDEQHRLIDTIPVTYQWDFGDGLKRTGIEVKYCFPGPGKYSVMLSIIDNMTGKMIADQVEYKVDLENIEQAYINSADIGIADKPISFNGTETNLKGFRITDYLWNFGDGFRSGGPFISKTFKKDGEYTVRMGLLSEKDSLGVISKRCVMKKIKIYNSFEEMNLKGEVNPLAENLISDSVKTLQTRIYFMDDLSERQKSKIRESLNKVDELIIRFDQYGIDTASYPFLDKIVTVLKENQDIRLELALHSINDKMPGNKMGTSDKWARELVFYFKNNGINSDSVRSKGFASTDGFKPVTGGNKITDGVIEFVFFKK